jgi:hypothetical protein
VEYLKGIGVVQGYSDGTFRPNQSVKRAEAVKLIVAPLVSTETLTGATGNAFGDIAADAWFRPYVEVARGQMGIVDGPPKATVFHGERTVTLVEFLKMFLTAQRAKIDVFSDVPLPLARDVMNPQEWYFPYMRAALAYTMVTVDTSGNLSPARQLTRADVAKLTYYFMMYRDSRRTQAALGLTETEIVNTLNSLEALDTTGAELASARALVAARGAMNIRGTETIVQAALKTAQSFRSLVRGYRAGQEGNLEETLRLAGEAWQLAEDAKQVEPSLASVSEQVQGLAKSLADSARATQAAGTSSAAAQ